MKELKEINDKIEQLSLLDFNQKEHERLLVQYKNVTQVEAFEDFIKACKVFMKALGAVSVLLGFGVPLMLGSRMPSLYYPSIAFFAALLFVVEYSKHWNLKRFNTLRIVNKNKLLPISLKKYILAMLFFVCLSMLLSFVGSPYVVKQFARHEALVSIQDIQENYEDKVELTSNHWQQLKEEYLAKAVQIHNENSWKGKTSREARTPKLAMELKASEMQDSLNSAVSYLRKQQDIKISEANQQNQVIIQKHEDFCFQFGLVGSGAALLIDILLIFLARVISNHDEKKITENEKRKELLNSLEEPKQEKKEKRKKKEPSKKQEPENQEETGQRIGFKKEQEGEIVKENGQEYVLLEMKKGKNKGNLVKKSRSDLKNLINNQSNPKRIKHLESLLQNFS